MISPIFSYSDFPVLSPILISLFFFLSQRARWQDFLYAYALLRAGVSEDGSTRCGEARAGPLYSSSSALSLCPVPWVP